MKFLLLIGLPGSGKTYFGKRVGLPFLDDVTQNGGIEAIKQVAETADTIILSDYNFIFPDQLALVKKVLDVLWPGCKFEDVVFENAPEKCWKNVQRRNDGRVISKESLFRAAQQFEYPENCLVRSVFSTE